MSIILESKINNKKDLTMSRIIGILIKIIKEKFTGDIIISFNQGGIRNIKKVKYKVLL